MSSTFSPSLRIELIGDGDQSGIWGQTTNSNLGTLIEQAIAGVVTIDMLDTNYTMSNFNGVSDEARNQVIVLIGTNTAARNLIAPLVEKTYVIKNSTVGGFAVQIIGSSGTGVTIPNGVTTSVYCDGTNFYTNLTGATGNFTVAGSLGVTGALSGSTAAFSGSISSVSPTFTGTPLSTTASPGTNTTQIATTAFTTAAVTAATGSLGTMSTQNANNVSITGGTIVGITDLTVADGGTGSSSLTANSVILGNGTSALSGNLVAPGTSGNVLTSNGTTWTSAAGPAPTSGAAGLGNGTTFTITTGSSGVALITVEFLTLATFGNFGGATGYLAINGSTVASKYTQTIEYSSRNSGCGGVILYRLAGSANTSYTGTFSWSGAGYLESASYMYIGI
jgi:hypothetical protein